ncbi:MAG: GGDEF domain-containing protein [Isosphaeraceae bacterium]|nr:GGDEF domain-containing protein [Isosphaeraceae bacterium]
MADPITPTHGETFDSLGGRAASWLGLRARREGMSKPADHAFRRLAALLADADSPRAVAESLTRVAHELASVRRVELVKERGWGAASVASWPPEESASCPSKRSTLPRSNDDWLNGRSSVIGIPARHAGRTIATLWLYAEEPRVWPAELVGSLAALAALCASSGFAPEETTEPRTTPAHDVATGLPNASFLEAFLQFAVAQARRKHEQLSLISIGIDRLEAIRKLHGSEYAGDACRFVARVIASTLRSSDLVAKLDDSRIIAVLPNARHENALLIAETLRDAVADAGRPNANMPELTICLGVVSLGEHAPDATGLLGSALEALVEARSRGAGMIHGPSRTGLDSRLRVVQCVG